MSEPSVSEYQAFARPKIEAGGYDWETFRKQIQQESGWRHLDASGAVKTSYTGTSKGVCQLNQNFYPESVWRDPWTNLSKGIELAIGYLARFGSHRKALASFNWGPGNVGGYTDGAGRVHPAWDGAREWRCPHEGAVAQCKTAQRDRYLDVILGPGWPEPTEAPVSGIVYEELRTPNVAGRFAGTPKGVVLHGSRSGKAGNPLDAEYRGTAAWCVNNPDGLGWHATIGEGRVAVHLDPKEWGWHARSASRHYIGVEIAQPTVDDDPTPCATATADYIFDRVWPVWGEIWHFPSHAELEAWGETGQRDGKTDLYPPGDERMNVFRELVYARLRERKGVPAPAPPTPTPPPPTPTPPPAPIRPDPRVTRARTLMRQAATLLDEVIAEQEA